MSEFFFIMKAIGEKFLKLRLDRGLTLTEAAEQTGIPERNYRGIEKGTLGYEYWKLAKLFEFYRVKWSDIFDEN